jgi:hypothetical protein
LANQFPAYAMILKGIPGDKNKFRIRFSGKMLNAADGLDSGATDPLGRLPNMGGLHADLPIGGVNESHAESSAAREGAADQFSPNHYEAVVDLDLGYGSRPWPSFNLQILTVFPLLCYEPFEFLHQAPEFGAIPNNVGLWIECLERDRLRPLLPQHCFKKSGQFLAPL